MKNSDSSFTSLQKSWGLRYPSHQVLPDTANKVNAGLHGKWLPTLIVSLYYLIQWFPPFDFLPSIVFRWYIVMGVGILLYILQNTPLIASASKLLWVVYGLNFLGAVVSLIRAPSLDLALFNTVAMGMNYIPLILFLPILAFRLTRGIALTIIIITAILWTYVIQQLVMKYGVLYYSTFAETGENKNAIGYGLALAATALFYLAVFWKPAGVMGSVRVMITRLIFGLAGFYLFYYQALIYAKGSLLATLAGMGAVLAVMFLKSPQKGLALFRIGLVLFFISIIIFLTLPKVIEISPSWNVYYLRLTNQGVVSIANSRDVLLKKGIYLITQNPFLGVGLGGSRAAVSSATETFPIALFHNTFLTNWAEKGIFGFLSDVVWIFAYIKILRRKFFDLHIIDQIWLLLFIPFVVLMNFKNISPEGMLLFLAGIYYEQYFIEKAKNSLVPEYKRRR